MRAGMCRGILRPMKEAEFAATLTDFTHRVTAVWDRYQDVGPGRVESALYERVESLRDQLIEGLSGCEGLASAADLNRETLAVAVTTVADLANRCACRSEGLCFITGEAGLIPRRDLHDRYATALAELQDALIHLSR